LFASQCYGCHNSKLDKPMGGLLLDSRAGMLRGGKSGVPAIIAGKPGESLLISAVRRVNQDLKMPPGKALEPYQIDALVEWIKMGAPDPRDQALPAAAPPPVAYDWEKARRHWAFQPVQDPRPPLVSSGEWSKSP